MKYKILCSDLDGTLLSSKSDVSDFAISEIERIRDKTRIILVSARMPRAMFYLQRRLGVLDQPIVCYTQSTPIFRDTSDTLKDWENRNIGAHKVMLMGTQVTSDILYPLLEKQFGEELHLYRSNDTLIEIAPKSVSKLTAIKTLLKTNESLSDVIAFGDNYNDIEMLEHCGYGVAVGNAREEVKAIADNTTLPNYEDGVAQFIKEHLEG